MVTVLNEVIWLSVDLVIAVLHWLVDHHWCSSEIPSWGRFSSCLSHLWSHRYSGLSHVRQTLQTVSFVGNARIFITRFSYFGIIWALCPISSPFKADGLLICHGDGLVVMTWPKYRVSDIINNCHLGRAGLGNLSLYKDYLWCRLWVASIIFHSLSSDSWLIN